MFLRLPPNSSFQILAAAFYVVWPISFSISLSGFKWPAMVLINPCCKSRIFQVRRHAIPAKCFLSLLCSSRLAGQICFRQNFFPGFLKIFAKKHPVDIAVIQMVQFFFVQLLKLSAPFLLCNIHIRTKHTSPGASDFGEKV